MKKSLYRLPKNQWYIERLMYIFAGTFVLVGVILGVTISFYFLYFTGFVGLMLIIFGITGYCPMAILLKKLFDIPEIKTHTK